MKVSVTATALAALAFVTACGGTKSTSMKKTVNVGSILSSNEAPSAKAEALALAAEQLLTPSGFVYADLILDEALKLDPSNKRAGLYKSFLAAPLSAKGILARIKPLAAKNESSRKKLEEMIAKLPEGNYKKFLLDGKPDISDEASAQAFVDSVIGGLDKFRQFAKDNKNLEIKLNVNDYLTSSGSYEYHSSHCSTYPSSNGSYTTECHEYSDAYHNETPSTFSMNRGDLEAIQHISAGYQIYASLLNSYSASGAIKVAQSAEGKTIQQIWKDLAKDANFGKLRNDVFARIPKLGADAIIGVRWALTVQNELCPNGAERSGQRPGMLFGNGICIKPEARDVVENALKTAELALSGGRFAVKSQGMESEVAPKAILDNPVKDLKALKPVFNKCGKLASVASDDLNGLFPNGDVNEILANSADCSEEF